MTLFGCMILIMEHKIGGLLRERLLVAHLRYKRCFSYPNLEQICELCRRHVPTPGTSASPGSSPFSSDIISIQKSEDLLRWFPYSCISVDLLVSWDAYKEAKSSLVSCLSPTSIRDISLHHYTKVSIAKHFILLLSKIFLFWMLIVNCSSIPTFFSNS